MLYDGINTKPSIDELYHHGIKGQKWGVQNGPPYPLDQGRRQTKYGFSKEGGNARKVANIASKVFLSTLCSDPISLTTSLIADARSVSYKPGETTDKHYIRKGTKMYRVSSVDKENNEGETYVTYNPVDRAFYRAYIKSKNPDSKVYETTFKATKDLVVPSQKELAEVQKKVIWDNPKLKKQSIEGFANFRSFGDYRKDKIDQIKKEHDEVAKKLDPIKGKGKLSPNNIDISYLPGLNAAQVSNKKTGKTITLDLEDMSKYTRYERVVQQKSAILDQVKNKSISQFSVVSLSMGTSKELKSAMIKELSKRGYNSMVDEAGIGALEVPGINDKKSGRVSREGVEPIIVFDRSTSLVPIKTKEVKDTQDDLTYYNRWRNKNDNAYRKITW